MLKNHLILESIKFERETKNDDCMFMVKMVIEKNIFKCVEKVAQNEFICKNAR